MRKRSRVRDTVRGEEMIQEMKNEVAKRPAGVTALASAIVVFVANKAGLTLGTEDALAIVGGLTTLVSLFSPRTIEAVEDAVEEIGALA